MIEPHLIEIKTFPSQKGILSTIDSKNNLPFEIRRIFSIYNIPINTERGNHAHKKLKQFIWVLNGVLEISTVSNDMKKSIFRLEKSNIGLYIPELTWSSQTTKSDNCIYCVAASDYYDESEYIRDFKDFILKINKKYEN